MSRVKSKVKQSDGNDLRYDATDATDATQTDTPIFANNTLHSLFSECTVTANGIKSLNANGVYAHKAFIETEYSNGKEAKNTWLRCQGYTYEQHPGNSTTTPFTNRELKSRQSGELTFFGKVSADVFSCDKHLLSGVTLRISFVRSKPEFVLIHDDVAKKYKITITQANLYVRKMTVSEQVFIAIEKTLTKSPALYRYTEVIPKTFLIPTGSRSWSKEDVFSREPIRRFALAFVNIYKHLEKRWSYQYIKKLHDFGDIINSRVNRGTGLAPKKVSDRDVPHLISLVSNKSTKQLRMPKFRAVDFVRVSKENLLFRKGYKQNFTDEIFQIKKIATLNPPTYNLLDSAKEKLLGKFYQPELILVKENWTSLKFIYYPQRH